MASPDEDSLARARSREGSVVREKYRLDRLLAVGGMAAVYEATHRNGKRCAVKILHGELSSNEGVRQRFLREGYAVNSVRQRGVVRIDDDDVTEDGAAYLVMELLEGETLETRLARKGGRLPEAEVLALADQILETLVAAHGAGVIHRDIKPDNVFLTRRGIVKLLDFGIARVRELPSHTAITQNGGMMGTPAFMAPEQAKGLWSEIDPRTDLWSLGATLFTLLSGHNVHEGRTVNEAFAAAVTRQARPLQDVAPEVHPAVATVVDRALAFERDHRWNDARAMQEAVRDAYAILEAEHAAAEDEAEPRATLPGAASSPAATSPRAAPPDVVPVSSVMAAPDGVAADEHGDPRSAPVSVAPLGSSPSEPPERPSIPVSTPGVTEGAHPTNTAVSTSSYPPPPRGSTASVALFAALGTLILVIALVVALRPEGGASWFFVGPSESAPAAASPAPLPSASVVAPAPSARVVERRPVARPAGSARPGASVAPRPGAAPRANPYR